MKTWRQALALSLALLTLKGTIATAQEPSTPTEPGVTGGQSGPVRGETTAESPKEDEDENLDEEIGAAPSLYGEAMAGYRHVDLSRKSHLFDQYQDLDSGVLLGTEGMYFRPSGYYGDFMAADLLQNDRSASYRGGYFGGPNFTLYGRTIIHNYSHGARTFYTSGVGEDNLMYSPSDYGLADAGAPPASLNAATFFTIPTDITRWREIDYQKSQDQIGAKLVLKGETPWYVSLLTDYRKTKGQYAQGLGSAQLPSYNNSSRFGHALEIPVPLDSSNLTFGAETGYTDKDYTLALQGELSRFDNTYEYTTFRDPYVTVLVGGKPFTQTISLAPDSTSLRLGVKGVAKNLPLASSLALNVSRTTLESDIGIRNTIADSVLTGAVPTYSYTTLGLSSDRFHGKIFYDNLSLLWNANPSDQLSASASFRYLKKDNQNDEFTFTNTSDGKTLSNERFGYDKNEVALGAGYKLPMQTKLDLSVARAVVNREERADAPKNEDRKVHLGLRNSSYQTVTGGVNLEFLDRTLEFGHADAGTGSTDPMLMQRYFKAYDIAGKTRRGIRFSLEYMATDYLTFTGEYGYAQDSYKDMVLGLREDKRDEIYVDATYERPSGLRAMAFYNVERSRNHGAWRQATSPANTDPNVPYSGTTSFNWTGLFDNLDYYYGADLQVPIVEDRLLLGLGYSRTENDGKAEFSSANPAVATPGIDLFGDYNRQDLSAKITYKPIKDLTTAATYVRQKFAVNDYQWNAYTPVNAVDRVFGGAFSDLSYDADLIYATVTYSF